MMGVYRIWSTVTKRYYIGKSDVSIRNRLLSHRRNMELGNIQHPAWADDVAQHGVESFQCEVVKYTQSVRETRELENQLIEATPWRKSYNLAGPRDGFDGERTLISFRDLETVRGLRAFSYSVTEICELTGFEPVLIESIVGRGPAAYSAASVPDSFVLPEEMRLQLAMRHRKAGWESWVQRVRQKESWFYRFLVDAGVDEGKVQAVVGTEHSEFLNDHRFGLYRIFDLEESPNSWFSNQIVGFRLDIHNWDRDDARADLYRLVVNPDGPVFLRLYEILEELVSEEAWGWQYRRAIGDGYNGPTRAPEFAVLRGDPPSADLVATLAEVRRNQEMAERNHTNYWYARIHADEMERSGED